SLPGIEAVVATLAADRKQPSARDLASHTVRAAGQDGVTRFDAMSRVIGHWIRQVRQGLCTLGNAREAVLDHNAAMLQPPWDEARVRREFEAILARDIKGNGPLPSQSSNPIADEETGPAAPPLSDDALAAAFIAAHGPEWRQVPAWGQWFHWTGRQWRIDETMAVREAVRHVCRDAATQAKNFSEAQRTASDKTISATLRVAASDPRVATATD